MKKMMVLLVFSLVLLAVPFSIFAYDNSPAWCVILPEAIWAAATGGGTWTTEIQIYARATATVDVNVWFFYSGGGGSFRGPFTITGLTAQHMTKYTNILNTIDSLDADVFTYYGKVGAIMFAGVDADDRILVQGKTLHSGGYGKTMNALNWSVASNYALFSTWRGMMIQGITNSSTYRSTCGFFNDLSSPISIRVGLIYGTDAWLGYEDITLAAYEFLAFDPFVRFGVSGTYTNCRIWVNPLSGTGRCMVFGASANNTTNDPAAHIAVQYD